VRSLTLLANDIADRLPPPPPKVIRLRAGNAKTSAVLGVLLILWLPELVSFECRCYLARHG
jgi:hypothetical protein